ncbi:MAG: cupredoxin domain-containing protein [Gammaproteobacteria bacterium]|nr:cupredoxin domain-containing protein [Gammaproteobacteria bacterium]
MWIVNALGLVAIGLIVWWFWFSKPKAQRVMSDVIDILVEGGVYTPGRIEITVGKPVRLRFLRKDASPCAEKVLFDDLGIAADLPLGQPVEISVDPKQPGEYAFTCQMQMYRGTLVAKGG